MRAMIYRSFGGPEKLEFADLPRPTPGPKQVLVKVVASSVNPVDWKTASGAMRLFLPVKFPMIPGFDIAGEVVELGPGVSAFAVGAKVHARISNKGGGAAEFVAADVDITVPMPAGMDFGCAAGLPLAGMTALQGLRDGCLLPLQGATERVLIVGASGGVGHLAVQIARSTGATVVGVCSARNAELVRSLGAHEVVDYAQPDGFAGQAPFDVIFDCVTGSAEPWLPRLAPKGRFASCQPLPPLFLQQAMSAFRSQRVRAVMLKTNAPDLRVLDALALAGKLRVVIDSRHKLTDLKAAWDRSLSGRSVGKIVVDVA